MARVLPCLALALVLLGAGCGSGGGGRPAAVRHAPASPFQGSAVQTPTQAPDFALRDQDGKVVRLADERGRLVVIAFLYTKCPDVCPLIASNLNTALQRLGGKREGVRVLAVSIDPKNDTPAAVRRFVELHRLLPEFRYLTGSKAELAKVWKAYHMAVVANAAGDTVGHTSYEVLVDRAGKQRVLFDAQVTADEVLHDIAAVQRGRTAS